MNPVEIDREDEEGGDAMMLMANDSDLEMLVSLDVLQIVNNRGSNNLNESRLCKGTLFTESSFLYNAYTTHNFIHLDYDPETDLLVTTTTVRIPHFSHLSRDRRRTTACFLSGTTQTAALKDP